MVVQHCEKLSISYQAQPKERWSVIERLGTMNGGLNSGITKVVAKIAPKLVFIEKRFNATQFKHKVPYREIQMLHQVSDHANIAKMVDHFLDESTQSAAVYLEFCDLGSLDVVVEQVTDGKHVHEHKMWNWLIQLTEAVAYLHRGPDPSMSDDELLQSGWSRMFHRDIKPANILLTTENGQIVAKLADFGCAISEDYLTLESDEDYAITQSVWTNGFDSPEHPFFSEASDIWQLGISMMSLCTGNLRPRSGNNPEGEAWSNSRPAGSRYSTELSWCVRWCLEKDRKARPTVRQVLNSVTTEYDQKMAMKLSFDAFPLEIFDRLDGQGRKLAQLASFPENAQAIPTPVRAPASPLVNIQQQGFDQHPNLGPWAGIGGYPASDYGYSVPQGRFRIGMGILYPSPYEADDDEYYHDPRTPQGFNPQYNPRRRNFR